MENVEQKHKGRRKHSRINTISVCSRGVEDKEEGRKILRRNIYVP